MPSEDKGRYIEPDDPRIPEAIKTEKLLCAGVRPYDDTIKVCHLQILIKIAQRYMLSGTPEEKNLWTKP